MSEHGRPAAMAVRSGLPSLRVAATRVGLKPSRSRSRSGNLAYLPKHRQGRYTFDRTAVAIGTAHSDPAGLPGDSPLNRHKNRGRTIVTDEHSTCWNVDWGHPGYWFFRRDTWAVILGPSWSWRDPYGSGASAVAFSTRCDPEIRPLVLAQAIYPRDITWWQDPSND